MGKRFVKVSLATKFRTLYGAAVLGIIASALLVPWLFMEKVVEQGIQRRASEVLRLRYNEFLDGQSHRTNRISQLYPAGEDGEGREGPTVINLLPTAATGPAVTSQPEATSEPATTAASLPAGTSQAATASGPAATSQPTAVELTGGAPVPRPALDPWARAAQKSFVRNRKEELFLTEAENHSGATVYRCFRALRVDSNCLQCHGPSAPQQRQFQAGQLVGMIDLTLPASASNEPLVWWTRGMFVAGGALATGLALVLFVLITQRLVLRPIRKLQRMADKVADGDLTVRSSVRTHDEFQRLGESFNEMLTAIADQHEKLRAANRALDLKLSELAEANVTLFQANKVKNEFLANVSHELRTPLNSILGFADLVGEGQDEKLSRYGKNIGSAAKNLLAMINDLLDVAKIEAGKAQVRLDKVSVTDTCQTLGALMQPTADKRQIKLIVQLDNQLPLIVTDGGKFQQILYNLLSNAIKFTPLGGQVTLSAGCVTQSTSPAQPQEGPGASCALPDSVGRTLGSGQTTAQTKEPAHPTDSPDGRDTAVSCGGKFDEVYVSVADTGPGIAEADQQFIFDKFYQADKTLIRESSGTGLGLAISKELTNLLGGKLSLKSSPGQGTVFTLTLPVDGGQKATA
jgi:signal transduction histidine kinase